MQITFIDHVYRVRLNVLQNITLDFQGKLFYAATKDAGNAGQDGSMQWKLVEDGKQGWNKNSCLVCLYPDEGNSIGDAGFNPLRENATVSTGQ